MTIATGETAPAVRAADGGSRLRILVVQPTGDKMGHYGIFTSKLSQALAHRGHVVTVCTNRIAAEQHLQALPAFAVELVDGGALTFAPFDAAASRSPLYYYWGYYRNSYRVTAAALALCRTRSFDVVYITDVEFLVASLLLKTAPRPVPPVVMEVNAANFSFSDYPGSPLKKGYKMVQRQIFRTTLGRQVAACAVLSEWHQERLRAQLRLPASFPLEVVPEGADAPEAPPPAAEARRRLGIAFEGPLFLFFGMLRRDKGIETLLAAVARLRGEEFRLLIAGFPIEYQASEVAGLVRRAGVEDRVVLRLGYVDPAEVPSYFGAADALVLPYAPSYRGGIGPLTKGACAYGRPVIGTDVAGMGDFIARHRIGLACPTESAEALAARMREFMRMPGEARQAMGERARAWGRAHSWDAMAAQFAGLFERVVRARGGPLAPGGVAAAAGAP